MSTSDYSFLRDKAHFEALLQGYIAWQSQLRAPKSQEGSRISIRCFRRWWLRQGEPCITHETLLVWMHHKIHRVKVKSMAMEVVALNQFMSFLMERGFLSANPLSDLRDGYRFRGYRGILQSLRQTDSVATVLAMADHPFSGLLGSAFLTYFDFHTALGKQYISRRYYLASFERFLRENNVSAWEQVDRAFVEEWLRIRKPASGY
ncbi:MAG: hypothetical protein P9X24_17295, partial [Candidatus Hatepunaea meridiana]|nr:hypothetical protein [Candidatus Hatepunaea meridiana]